MKLESLIVIFIIIIVPIIILMSVYINTGIKTINMQVQYDEGLITATHDAIYAFELNTINNPLSGNPEQKRDILKSSIKMFEKSLCNSCNISSYNTLEIEEYIPAMVFGMYDGFYMYTPSETHNSDSKTIEYKHNLKSYVYYSETLSDGTIIRYSLDNYVVVIGNFVEGKKEGYLINTADTNEDGTKYKEISIKDTDAKNYYKEAYEFTTWFNSIIPENDTEFLKITSNNNPEDEISAFVQHKRKVIKEKMEAVLNLSISSYSKRIMGKTYKMPKFSEEEWQRIYSDISVITFFQGKNIGLTKYNGYCVLNSTNNNEYVNPNLMYFIDDNNEYHDIRCKDIVDKSDLKGYRIGSFQKIKLEESIINKEENGKIIETVEKDANGNILYIDGMDKVTNQYKYNHKNSEGEYTLACYSCINGQLDSNSSVYEYINDVDTDADLKTAYWNALGRERYNTVK